MPQAISLAQLRSVTAALKASARPPSRATRREAAEYNAFSRALGLTSRIAPGALVYDPDQLVIGGPRG